MSLGTLTSCNDLPPFAVYETITAPSSKHHITSCTEQNSIIGSVALSGNFVEDTNVNAGQVVIQRRKRRARQMISKNKEEAENQRMTHIAVERNRRRLMNEHLAVLRSLVPESYIHRVDQASVVGGAIDYVKELEQNLQYLEVQKRTLQQQKKAKANDEISLYNTTTTTHDESSTCIHNSNQKPETRPFSKFFSYPQYTWYHATSSDYIRTTQDCLSMMPVGDIEVKLIETHANVRILTAKRSRQLLKIVAGLQALRVSILHLNVSTMDAVVLYSISLKVEEGCNLTTVDDIAAAVHHLLTLVEAEVNKSTLV